MTAELITLKGIKIFLGVPLRSGFSGVRFAAVRRTFPDEKVLAGTHGRRHGTTVKYFQFPCTRLERFSYEMLKKLLPSKLTNAH